MTLGYFTDWDNAPKGQYKYLASTFTCAVSQVGPVFNLESSQRIF